MQLQIIIKLIYIDLRFYKLLISTVQYIFFHKLTLIFSNCQSTSFFFLQFHSQLKSSKTCTYFMWVRANFKTLKAVLSIYRNFLQEMMSYTFVHLGSSEFENISISETLRPAPSTKHSVCHTCLHGLLVLSVHIVLVSQYVF